jgi:hypothetical protein
MERNCGSFPNPIKKKIFLFDPGKPLDQNILGIKNPRRSNQKKFRNRGHLLPNHCPAGTEDIYP